MKKRRQLTKRQRETGLTGRRYTVCDGRLTLVLLEAVEGGYVVRCPIDPAVITQADDLEEAFEMARDAMHQLALARRDRHRWDPPASESKRSSRGRR